MAGSISLEQGRSIYLHANMVHPLLLPNVLDNIFSNFSLEQLAILRLVNLDWNHAVCIAISKRKTINFCTSDALERYQLIFRQSPFCLHTSFNFQLKIPENDFQKIQNFFEDYRYLHVRSLSLILGSPYFSVANFIQVLSLIPQLESLGLKFHYFKCAQLEELNSRVEITPLTSLRGITIDVQSYQDYWGCTTNLLCSIFVAAPNLSKIHHPLFCIPQSKCRIISTMNIYLTELILEDAVSANSSFAYLNFILKLNSENIHSLISKKYPLKHLYLNMWYPDDQDLCVTSASVKTLMAQLCPTLEKLGLDFPWRMEVAYEFSFQFPMKNLSYLSLNGFQGSLVGLLKKLPNLSYIELSQVDLFEILPASQICGSYFTVTKLRLDFCINQQPGALSRLSRVFPNLRSLNVNHTTDDICRMIFKKMLNLTYLRLHGDDLSDEGLTGITLEKIKENNLISSSSIEAGNALRCFAFVGDLPKLRELKLEAYKLTEVSIKHGIVHCANLRFVSMDTRLERNDPSATVTRTFRLSEYGKRLVDGEKEVTLILQEEVEGDEDEDAEKFFRMYETSGMLKDLMFA